ncbi:MAG: phosphoglycerate kinase [Oceanibaculum nanhaiense]|jgi:phosphoglycerate kinase|uniref:phosphoglycerate kinase n=1 Tax=Oceanibaculum nanhaiense TaxID=1909734 RepID=UPI0032ECBE91
MARFKTIDDLAVAGKRVLVRADLNVPMQDGKVSDATRIERLAPTLLELADKGARVIVLSHFGRPKGKADAAYSLRPLVGPLSAALGGRPVVFAGDCVGEAAKTVVDGLQDGGIALLENTRFHEGEEKNDPALAQAMADLGDFYVNDAFSAAHRAHASTEGIARLLPSAAGRLMQQELEALEKALTSPQRPVMAVVGGAKVSSKLDLLGNLVARVDKLAIGGGMANTFLFAKGVEVGKSLCERDLADTAREILAKAEAAKCKILLQTDAVVADALAEGAKTAVVGIDAVPADRMILDIGPKTAEAWQTEMAECRTLVWNGPVGAFETAPFDAGTVALARAAAKLTEAGTLLSVAGGGDTVAALNHAGVEETFSYVSSAGGAFLEWLEGKTLPGVAALMQG